MTAELATSIAELAVTHSARMGRRSWLRHPEIVGSVLDGLARGRSRLSVARVVGVSEGAIRYWQSPAGRPEPACAAFRVALVELCEQRAAAAAPAAIVAPTPVQAEQSSIPVGPAPPPSREAILAAVLQPLRPWLEEAQCIKQRLGDAPMAVFLGPVLARIRDAGADVDWPYVVPLYLPDTLPYHARVAQYLAWCAKSGQPGPTDAQLDSAVSRWFNTFKIPAERIPGVAR